MAPKKGSSSSTKSSPSFLSWVLASAHTKKSEAAAAADPKAHGWLHPLLSWTGAYAVVCTFMFGFYQTEPDAPTQALKDHQWVGWLLLSYYAFLLIPRLFITGARELYHQLWACNMAMGMSIIGILYERRIMTGVALALVLPDQPLWYGDVAFKIFTGTYKIGVARYLDWPETPTIQKITAWHHLWYLPLVAWYMVKTGGEPNNSLFLAWIATAVMHGYCRLVSPKDLNVNMSWMFQKDVKVAKLHALDNAPAIQFVTAFSLCMNMYMSVMWLVMWFIIG